MDRTERCRIHAALGDPHRLAMVDLLLLGDRSVRELMVIAGVQGNLAAHHLDVLEAARLIVRHPSEGDRRRRYVSLCPERLSGLLPAPCLPTGPILFVCTHNSARSQFAAALWRQRTGEDAQSAGADPAQRVDPRAVEAAIAWGLDLRAMVPRGYAAVTRTPALVVSVCDRAREAGLPFRAPALHWSVPDPVRAAGADAFRVAFATIAARIDRLAPLAPRERPATPHADASA